MRHPHRYALLAFALGAAYAAPTSPSTDATDTDADAPGLQFKLHQVPNPSFRRSALRSMAWTHAKHNKPLPPHLQRALSLQLQRRQESGAVSTTPQPYDSQYLVNVSIGTPPQSIPLDFDTGSADLWVSGALSSSISGAPSYSTSKSNTSKAVSGASWSIQYGDGSTAEGNVYTDVVSVGGLHVEKQGVEVAVTESSSFLNNKNMSGIFGLAFGSLNQVSPDKQRTWFENVKGGLAEPVFAVDLRHDAPGAYDFGFIDNTSYTGSLTYTSADNSSGFWGFTATSYAIGTGSQNHTLIKAIVDTGTSLLYLPRSTVVDYYAQISGSQNSSSQGGFIFPCSAAVPSFSFSVEFNTFTVPSKFLSYEPVGDGTCFGGIQDDSSIGFSIFGDVALKSLYVVFSDSGQGPQLGFASKNVG